MLTLTPKAAEKIKTFFDTEATAKGKSLRVSLEPSGCAGFKYAFSFDDKRADDTILPQQAGFEVLLDKNAEPYLEKATIDYSEDAMGAGFKILNPQEKGSCGCGQSKKFE